MTDCPSCAELRARITQLEQEKAILLDAVRGWKIIPRPWIARATGGPSVTFQEWDEACERLEVAEKLARADGRILDGVTDPVS
jgi:hypothetical protein